MIVRVKRSERAFADLLTEGIYKVRLRETKTIQVIQDELGYALGKKGGASIEYWRKGHIPTKLTDIENLARELVKRGQLDRLWLEKFLQRSGHPAVTSLSDELFPPSTLETSTQEIPPLPKEPFDKLNELPIDRLPEPAPLPPGSLMPFSKNPLFVGRETDLQTIATALKKGDATAISQVETTAATGLGGIGKTQLASEFVHRYGQYFSGGVFWLSFADAQAIPAQIAACGDAGALELRDDFGSLPLKDQIKMVRAAWQSPLPRLLVFDNCEDPTLLAKWRPATGGCRVLVTCRRGDWDVTLGVKVFALGVLNRPESLALLRQHCPHVEVETSILDAIAEELGDLPLALHLAGFYLNRYHRVLSPSDYLHQLQDPSLLHHPSMQAQGLSPTGHVQTVGRTFALSYDRLDLEDEIDTLAQTLLVHTAHFAPGEPIWYKLLVQTLELDTNDPSSILNADLAFSRLIELGLIETEQNNILRIHRLIAAFVRDVAADKVAASQQAVEAVVFEETANINQAGYPMPLLAWQLHLRSVVDIAQAREDEQGADLCDELGQHLWQIGDYDGAYPYYEKALVIRKKLFGENHLDTAHSLSRMGYLLHSQGKFAEALPYFEQALAIQESLLGKENIAVAKSLNYLGQVYYAQGNFTASKAMIDQALKISLKVLGEEHKLTAEYLNNMGMCLLESNELEGALLHLQRALSINEKVLGLDHPNTAMNCNNISLLLNKMDRLPEAQEYCERALAIRKKTLGDEHADTGQSLKKLGDLLYKQGELVKANLHLNQALQVYRKAYQDEDHPRVALCLVSLGKVKQLEGNFDQAIEYLDQALSIQRNTLAEDHPAKAFTLQELGFLYADRGESARAKKYIGHALQIYKTNPGSHHLEIQRIKERLSTSTP